ncbi:hypothetical protein HDU87_000311 [Geranomyces variabilis]|uniref:Serine aminopeptidase S33 domain-containing protein n=1 Tax=Geranomyces variabilis TaxID=109894 RepID=A0AAD5TNG3_9FUNG|nr:hypothetical protein HDU87_000311 [Geranomyces variabilis]
MTNDITTEEWVAHSPTTEVYHRMWSPPPGVQLRATLVFVHGVGEHVCRYDHVFTPFALAGIKVRAFDERGFGQTVKRNGILGHNEGYDTVMADVDVCADRVKVEGVPHFVMGHSMGGGVILQYALRNQNRGDIRGVIASAPLIGLGALTAVSIPEYYGVRVLATVFSTLAISNPVDANNLSRDPVVVQDYTTDPLVHSYTSMGTARDIVLNGENLSNSAHNFKLPVLVVCGDADRIISYKDCREWFVLAGSSDKSWKSYDGFYHELHNEPEKEQVIQLYIDWILERV